MLPTAGSAEPADARIAYVFGRILVIEARTDADERRRCRSSSSYHHDSPLIDL